MAEAYFKCGNDQLGEAAKAWGRKNAHSLSAGSGPSQVSWGTWVAPDPIRGRK
jgi:hypothetical protein